MIRFVAEIGSMHEGSPALACEMARLAKWAGADIFKMQLGWPKDDPVRHVSYEFAGAVADYCRLIGIEFMASIWSEAGLDIAQSVGMKRFKIAHQMADDPLVEKVLLGGAETFVSVTTPIDHERPWRHNVRWIFTTDQYPTLKVEGMPPSFHRYYGYSDHTHGIETCLLAVARGARYIEKHFTLNKVPTSVRDNPFSASPEELKTLVEIGRPLSRVAIV